MSVSLESGSEFQVECQSVSAGCEGGCECEYGGEREWVSECELGSRV